jgi:hypothetical protein
VKYYRVLKWSLVPLLLLTFGWKLSLGLTPIPAQEPKYQIVVDFLARHRFSAVLDKEMFSGLPPVIAAKSDDCSLDVVETWPLLHPIDPIEYLAEPADYAFIVFRGATYEKEPWLLTALAYMSATLRSRLGSNAEMHRVLAVIASCDARWLPWSELRDF